MSGRRSGPVRIAVLMLGLVAACAGPIAANPPVSRPSPPATPAPVSGRTDPQPIVFPRDDAPHDRLTEWWYYTGHLRDVATGDRFGFEFVIFRAERGAFPVSWASHLALTDENGRRFLYAQRTELGPAVDRSGGGPTVASGTASTFDLSIASELGADPTTLATAPWRMTRAEQPSLGIVRAPKAVDRLVASLSPSEARSAGAAFGIDLRLGDGPVVLHNSTGWIDFGPAGGSYYYSRPRMQVAGTLTLGDRQMDVAGEAWFDHQWGDFIAVGGGGWDWFAVNLADRTDLTLSLVRGADGSYPLVYGTLRRSSGEVVHLPARAFTVTVLGHWTSPSSHATYPAGWRLDLPGERLTIELAPTMADQELDTRPTTGVVYWEGSQIVRATRDGRSVGGEAYVELTGYAPSGIQPAASPSP